MRRRGVGVGGAACHHPGVRSLAALAAAVVAATAALVAPAAPTGAADPPALDDLELAVPGADQAGVLTVEATGADAVSASVVVGFAAPQAVALADDGQAPDQVAGDGTWSAAVGGWPAGTLVRFRATATGAGGTTSLPADDEEARHEGIVVARPEVATDLPVLDWYIDPAVYADLMADLGSKQYRPAVLVYGDEVYDGVRVRLQGGPISQAQPKKNLRFKMPGGAKLDAPELAPEKLEEFLLDAEFDDPTGVRAETAWALVDAAGGPGLAHAKLRVERNGTPHGVFTFRQEYGEDWLEDQDIEDGSLLYETADESWFHDLGVDGVEQHWDQQEPGDAPHDALAALLGAVDAPTGAGAAALDRLDLPALVDHLALAVVTGNTDNINHNTWLHLDPRTDRWRVLPWDLDIVLGGPGDGTVHAPLWPAAPNLLELVLRDPRLAQMVLRRVRTLGDALLVSGQARATFDAALAALADDMALDDELWPVPESTEVAAQRVRAWIDRQAALITTTWAQPGLVPPAPTGSEPVVVSELAPGPGGFVELGNPGPHALDVSGWQLEGAAAATLPPGSVMAAGGRLVVPADVRELVAGVLAAGDLDAALPGSGSLVLRDANGTVRDQVAWQPGGGWPTAPAGHTYERVAGGSGTSGAGWTASAQPGGTPSATPPPAPGLQVEMRVDRTIGSGEIPVGVDVAVANTGATALDAVAVDGPGSACDRTVPRLGAGARTTFRCPARLGAGPALMEVVALQTTARAGTGPVVATPHHVVVASDVLLSGVEHRPALVPPAQSRTNAPGAGEVLLHPSGRLSVSWDPSPPTPRAYDVVGRPVGTLAPTVGTTVPGTVRTARLEAPVGQAVQVLVASKGYMRGGSTTPSPGVTPRPSTTWPAVSPAAWSERTLRFLLGRTPTAGERQAWTSALAAGTVPSALVEQVLDGGRWQTSVAKVARLYTAFFARPSDTSGLQFWSARLDAGVGISVVAQAFARSPEFAQRFGAVSDTAFVTLVYRNVLGREPDASGLAHWVGRLEAGRTRGWVMAAFSESAEGRRLLAPTTDPVVAHVALVGTSPTRAWWDDAAAWLRAGGSRRTVIESVRTSDAFAARP